MLTLGELSPFSDLCGLKLCGHSCPIVNDLSLHFGVYVLFGGQCFGTTVSDKDHSKPYLLYFFLS